MLMRAPQIRAGNEDQTSPPLDRERLEFDVSKTLNFSLRVSADLPVELLVRIGGFVAGDNAYGTLLSLCLTSKGITQELRSALYETVFEPDVENMQSQSGNNVEPEVYRYAKVCLPL